MTTQHTGERFLVEFCTGVHTKHLEVSLPESYIRYIRQPDFGLTLTKQSFKRWRFKFLFSPRYHRELQLPVAGRLFS